MRKEWIAWGLISALLLPLFVGATAAFVFVDPAAKIQRLVIMANQLTQTTNQVTQITNMVNQLTQLTDQFQHIKAATMGQIQALTQPFTQLASQGTGLVSDGMSWKSQFSGVPGDLANAVTTMGNSGTSLTSTWSGWLQQADTVSESDIVDLYTDQPPALSQAAAEGWRENRQRADKKLVMNNAVADAAAELTKALKEAKVSLDGLQNQSNVSDTALAQAELAGSVTQGNIAIALAQLQAYQAAKAAAESYEKEVRRRERLDAWVTSQRQARQNLQARITAVEAKKDDMRQGLLLKVHPYYGYSYGEQTPTTTTQ